MIFQIFVPWIYLNIDSNMVILSFSLAIDLIIINLLLLSPCYLYLSFIFCQNDQPYELPCLMCSLLLKLL